MLDLVKSFLSDTAVRAGQLVTEVRERVRGDADFFADLEPDDRVIGFLSRVRELPSYSETRLLEWALGLRDAVVQLEDEANDDEFDPRVDDAGWNRPVLPAWIPMVTQDGSEIAVVEMPSFGSSAPDLPLIFRPPVSGRGSPLSLRLRIDMDPVLSSEVHRPRDGEVSEVRASALVAGFAAHGMADMLPQVVLLVGGQEVELRGPLVVGYPMVFATRVSVVGFIPDEVLSAVAPEHRRVMVTLSVQYLVQDDAAFGQNPDFDAMMSHFAVKHQASEEGVAESALKRMEDAEARGREGRRLVTPSARLRSTSKEESAGPERGYEEEGAAQAAQE